MLGQVDEDVVGLSVGDDNLDAFVCHFACNMRFSDHSATSEATLLIDNIFSQIAVVVDHWYDARAGFLRISVVDAVDVTQDDKRVAIQHGGDEPRKLVVVGEHQFGDTHRVVFIDNGNDTVFKHHLHTCALVEILAACGEALFHREHLTYMAAILTEKVVVESHEFHLAKSREELSLLYAVELVLYVNLVAPASHGTR